MGCVLHITSNTPFLHGIRITDVQPTAIGTIGTGRQHNTLARMTPVNENSVVTAVDTKDSLRWDMMEQRILTGITESTPDLGARFILLELITIDLIHQIMGEVVP
jgi:hypothetical protein